MTGPVFQLLHRARQRPNAFRTIGKYVVECLTLEGIRVHQGAIEVEHQNPKTHDMCAIVATDPATGGSSLLPKVQNRMQCGLAASNDGVDPFASDDSCGSALENSCTRPENASREPFCTVPAFLIFDQSNDR